MKVNVGKMTKIIMENMHHKFATLTLRVTKLTKGQSIIITNSLRELFLDPQPTHTKKRKKRKKLNNFKKIPDLLVYDQKSMQ